MANLWTIDAQALADAYVRGAGTLRFELVSRAILAHVPTSTLRVADIGGGYGQQAILLARLGHSVDILDVDPAMLALAEQRALQDPPHVSRRIRFQQGWGHHAPTLLGTGYDLACCHSVLMYEEHPEPILKALVQLVAPDGLISILCVNRQSTAMRSGLQGRWRDVVASLRGGRTFDATTLPVQSHTPEEIGSILECMGAHVIDWYGVGVFTDHLTQPVVAENPAEVYEAEWLAGKTDPYRQVARCFHLIAKR